jgi:hypothetical protein
MANWNSERVLGESLKERKLHMDQVTHLKSSHSVSSEEVFDLQCRSLEVDVFEDRNSFVPENCFGTASCLGCAGTYGCCG